MRSLSRALEVFAELQRADRPQRLSDLARTCGMSLPTTLRILRVLQDFGMVSQTDKSYRIGPAVLPAARSYLENDPLVVSARPVLQQVASQTGLTVSLYTRLGFERILVARVDGASPLTYDLPLGKRLPLTVGAAGKILLASATEEELQQVTAAAIAAGQEDSHIYRRAAALPVARARDRVCVFRRRACHGRAVGRRRCSQQGRPPKRVHCPDQPGRDSDRTSAQSCRSRTTPRRGKTVRTAARLRVLSPAPGDVPQPGHGGVP